MTDDTTDDTSTDDTTEQTNADGGEDDDIPATAPHEHVWRCTGCKAQYGQRPEQCEHCGGTAFQRYRDL